MRSSFCVLSWAKMQRSLEQRYAIKLRAKFGKSGSETLHLLRTAYGDVVLSSAQVLRWHKAFKDKRESAEHEQRAGRPSTSRTENNVARVKAVLDRDRRLSVRLMAEEVGLLKTDVHRIRIEDLHMRNTANTCSFTTTMHQVTSFAVREFLVQHNIKRFPTHRTSPHLVPYDFFLLPKLKTHLKGHHFGTVGNVQAAATRALNNISSEDFLHCYEEWQQCWNRCIRLQGAYFEGDKL